MNILQAAQLCAGRLQITSPLAIVANADGNATLLRSMLLQTLKDIANDFPWPELQKEGTFTLATGFDSYSFNADYDSRQSETLWNRSKRWPLIGPLTGAEWQQFKSGLLSTQPRQRFRIKSFGAGARLFIDPVPASSENGQIIVYEYVSVNVLRPKTWLANTLWSSLRYCSYLNKVYDRGAPDFSPVTTGATPPTWDGTASDGTISWTRVDTNASYLYDSPLDDSDEIILDPYSIIDGAVWRFKRERNLPYEELRQDAESGLELAKSKLSGGGVISVRGATAGTPMIGPWSYPEQDFGI